MTGSQIDSESQSARFYAAAASRMLKSILVFGVAVTPLVAYRYGLLSGLGFAIGGAVSALNFYELVRGVRGLADRIVDAHSTERGRSIVLRFVFRYLLVGVVAYVIFKGSAQAFRGFLFGLCLPVAAMLGEAGYEAYAALRRGY